MFLNGKWCLNGPGDSYMKGAGILVGNFELNPQKKTNLGMSQPFLTPKTDHFKLWLHESIAWISSDYFESLLRGENGSKQSDEFQANESSK